MDFLGSEIKTRYTLCVRYTLCDGGPSLGAKLRIPDDFPPNIFPITPPGNGIIGSGYRYLLESGFKICENSPMPKKIAREIKKIKTSFLQHDYFRLLKLKM